MRIGILEARMATEMAALVARHGGEPRIAPAVRESPLDASREVRDLIRRPELTQFAQRVSAAFHLEAMDAPTVRAYIRHHLAVAGTARDQASTATNTNNHRFMGRTVSPPLDCPRVAMG